MAATQLQLPTIIAAALLLLLLLVAPTSTSAEVVCERLPTDLCAYAISASSKRCVLESSIAYPGAPVEYQCKTSEVVVERLSDWIETDACVSSCGLDRSTTGISSDAFFDQGFTAKLCSQNCYHNCPNVVDLYFNLAAGEGVFLPDLCEAGRLDPHRSMVQLLSSGSGLTAPSPSSPQSQDSTASAPAPSPSA